MKTAKIKQAPQNHRLNALFLALVILSGAINGANARAGVLSPSDYRILEAVDKFDGVRQYAVTFKIRPPRRLRSRRLELAVGTISSSTLDQPFVSFGPVWHFSFAREAAFVELGFAPTLIGGSRFEGQDLGGNVHFTSSVSIGATFGRQDSIALAIWAQHTSNGGLSDVNPGIDMLGLNITFNVAGR